MKISRNNYELFFTDYLDGTLRDQQITELEDFLLLNPDLREELEGMEKIGLIPENLLLTDKDILRKIDTDTTLSEDNFDDFCAAYIEGDLIDEKISALESYIVNHPEHKPDLEIYRQTTLVPDSSIVYSSKNKLKKNSPAGKRVIFYSALSAAAAIVLLMIIFRGIDSPDSIPIPLTGNPDHPESETTKTEKVPIDIIAEYQHNEKQGKLPSATEKIAKPIIKTTIHNSNDNLVKEDHHLAENITSENFEIRDISLAGLSLPAVEPIRAQPEVIKGFDIPDESTFVIPPLTNPDYLSLPDIALNFINNKVIKLDEPIDEMSRLSLWEVVDASIKGINRLTGSDMKLDKQSGVNGELKAISFDAGIIGFSRSIK